MNTRVGHIARMLSEKKKSDPNDKPKFDPLALCGIEIENNQTPLQESLQELGVKIGYLAIAVCALVFIVGVALNRTDEEKTKTSPLYMILVSVTLAVAAIPEGEGNVHDFGQCYVDGDGHSGR